MVDSFNALPILCMYTTINLEQTGERERVWERKEETRLKRFITWVSVLLDSDWSIVAFSSLIFMYNDHYIVHFTVDHATYHAIFMSAISLCCMSFYTSSL